VKENCQNSDFLLRAKAFVAVALVGVGITAGSALSESVNNNNIPSYKTNSIEGSFSIDTVDDEYIKETLKLVKDMKYPIPVERIRNCLEAWRIREYGEYAQELRSLGLELESFVECGAKIHYAYEKSTWLSTSSSDNFQNYISLSEIDKQLLAGEKETNLKKRAKIMKNFLLDDEGNPVMLVVSATDSIGVDAIKKYFKKADQKYKKNGVENFYSGIVDSGACVYFTAKLQPKKDAAACLLDEWGVINHNINKEDTKRVKDFTNQFCRNAPVESQGVGFCQSAKALGLYTVFRSGDGLQTGETVKDMISGEILVATGNKDFVILGNGMFDQAKPYAQELGVSIDDPWILRQKDAVYAVYDVVGENLLKKKK